MDYSQFPESNKQPNVDNFLFLQEMYGGGGAVVAAAQQNPGNRLLRTSGDVQRLLTPKVKEAILAIESRSDGLEHRHGWRDLHVSEHGTQHELDLGGGYAMRVYKLLADGTSDASP